MADEQGQNEVIAFTPDQTEQIQTVNERMMLLQEQLQAVIAKLTPEQKRAAEEGIKYIQALLPYIDEEIKDLRQQPGYKKYTRRTIGRYIAVDGEPLRERNGEPVDREIVNLIERAKEKLSAASDAEQLPKIQINSKGVEYLTIMLDKVNSKLLDIEPGEETLIETGGRGSGIGFLCKIDIEEAGVTSRELTPFDRLCYTAVASLYHAGYEVVTIPQIHYAMGNRSRANEDDIEKIKYSLIKMLSTVIYLNNESEIRKYKYPLFNCNIESILPMKMKAGDAIVNGQMTKDVIYLTEEPPLLRLARERNQITMFRRKLLEEMPLSKTNANLRLIFYLIDRIAHIKNGEENGKSNNKMLFETIFENAKITTPTQRSRGREKILVCLEYFKEKGFIEDYKETKAETKKGVTIKYTNKKKIAAADEKP